MTFDIDWAPDASIELCLDLLDRHDVKATFFATHLTDLNQEIVSRGHELGIHPNFLPGSTHGTDTTQIIETCLEFAPAARYLRTHSLVQSSRLFHEIFGRFPQLTTDISLLMHKARHVQRCRWGFNGVSFDRILYNWEDDAEFDSQDFDYTTPAFYGDLTIYDFHPIHVHLNSRTADSYQNLRNSLGARHLTSASTSEIERHRNPQPGSFNFITAVLDSDAKSIALADVGRT